MKFRYALMAVLASVALFSACEEEEELGLASLTSDVSELSFDVPAGQQTISLTATRDWSVKTKPDWVAVDPDHGSASTKAQNVTITVQPNPDMDRTGNVIFTIGFAKTGVAVHQKGEAGSEEDALIYFNDFDKELATKTFGASGESWPYLDQFDGWQNHSGNGAADVTYRFKSMSARANSASDSNYSDYEGSGANNMFFGSGSYFVVDGIALSGQKDFVVTFGTERYLNDATDNTFNHDEFHVYVSADGVKWSELTYTFANGDPNGRWDLATARFSTKEAESALHICVKSDLASAHRLDDLKLTRGTASDAVIDLAEGVEIPGISGGGDTPGEYGSGTLEDPYTVAGAINAVKDLTWTSNTDYQTTGEVYVKGKISEIANKGTYGESGDYGNASFYITADGTTGGDRFYAYRILYLGNKKYEKGQTDIKVGDEVVICGKLMNYRGDTPETVANATYLYSLNGETSPGGDTPEPPTPGEYGSGTLEDPYTPAGAINAVKDLTWTSNDDYQTTGEVYVKGKISEIANKGTYGESGDYGNASFYITADGTTSGDRFYAFRILYLGNKKYEKGQTDIKVGDEVVIYGKLMNYRGNTPETVANASYLYSLNGETSPGGDTPEPPTPGENGSGTLEDPYTPAGAINAVKDLTWTSNTDYQTTGEVYVKGKISEIANKGTYGESGDYGNASFYITADGTTSGDRFYAFRILYLGNKKYEKGQTDIKVGDEVIIYGKLMNYREDTPETVANASYLYSLNGETSSGGGDEPGGDDPDQPTEVKTATIAEFIAAEESSTQKYQLTGTVSNITNTTYGNFDLTDETGTVYVYGLTATDLGYDKSNDKSFANIGIKEGDKITIIGYRSSYNSQIQVKSAYFVSKEDSGDEPGGGDEPGEFTGGDYTIKWNSASEWTKGDGEISYKSSIFGVLVKKNDGTSNPTVNTNYNDCRAYAKNTVTISANGATITKIVFNLSAQGLKRLTDITASDGTVKTQSSDDKTVEWTGSATSVTFTVGESAKYGSDGAEKGGQLDFSSIDLNATLN